MPLQRSWVDHLFAKLTVRYGALFTRAYADLDPELVKADWAEVLDGFDGESLTYGLRYLPSAAPPNAMQFRDICRRAPVQTALAITGPVPKADPAMLRVAADIAASMRAAARLMPAQQCVVRLRQIEAQRGNLNPAQRSMLDSCERFLRDRSAA